MPNWKEVLEEINRETAISPANAIDKIRRKYLCQVAEKTNRNVIAYYSGFLDKPNVPDTAIGDKDKNAFMVNIHRLDRKKGLDLILHTPGGDLAATESLVSYLKSMFGNDIRAIIPQISMSAGTMIAFLCKSIMMGKQSNLGPIDPQINGVPCDAVLEEFEQAKKEVIENPNTSLVWKEIIGKYHPTFLNSCLYSKEWAFKLAKQFLNENMCSENKNADKILSLFSKHNKTRTHSRHICIDQCKKVGLKIENMEDDNELQDLILTTHHAFMHTFNKTGAVKIVENNIGGAYIEALNH